MRRRSRKRTARKTSPQRHGEHGGCLRVTLCLCAALPSLPLNPTFLYVGRHLRDRRRARAARRKSAAAAHRGFVLRARPRLPVQSDDGTVCLHRHRHPETHRAVVGIGAGDDEVHRAEHGDARRADAARAVGASGARGVEERARAAVERAGRDAAIRCWRTRRARRFRRCAFSRCRCRSATR